MSSEAQARASAKYDKTHTRQIKMKLNLKNDAEILSKLDSVENIQGYIKSLILADIRKERQ